MPYLQLENIVRIITLALVISMGESAFFKLPPGFRFNPSDEELILHYLKRKATSLPFHESIIAEINLYKYNPWDLANKGLFGDKEYYLFTKTERKYPKGKRPNRAAGLGYWKATGTDKPIFSSLAGLSNQTIGVKKGLVFYTGRAPRGKKTDWSMIEYRLLDSPKLNGTMIDDWVLCRVRCRPGLPKSGHKMQESHGAEILRSEAPKPKQIIIPRSVNSDIISDYVRKNCGYLAWILSGGQSVPPMEIRTGFGLNHSESEASQMFSEEKSFNLLDGESSENNNLTSQNISETNVYSSIQNQFRYDYNQIGLGYPIPRGL